MKVLTDMFQFLIRRQDFANLSDVAWLKSIIYDFLQNGAMLQYLWPPIRHGARPWERVLVSRLEDFWQTAGTKDDYVNFLSKYLKLWFTYLDDGELETMLAK